MGFSQGFRGSHCKYSVVSARLRALCCPESRFLAVSQGNCAKTTNVRTRRTEFPGGRDCWCSKSLEYVQLLRKLNEISEISHIFLIFYCFFGKFIQFFKGKTQKYLNIRSWIWCLWLWVLCSCLLLRNEAFARQLLKDLGVLSSEYREYPEVPRSFAGLGQWVSFESSDIFCYLWQNQLENREILEKMSKIIGKFKKKYWKYWKIN